ncbi:MAG: N-acetyltransferase family protein [Rhodospirillaceae bacterium]
MSSPFSLRPAAPFDAESIARIHVQSWRESYPGIIPDNELAGLSVFERATRWRHILTLPAADQGTFVAARDGALLGFGDCGRQRSQVLPFVGEVNALYVLKDSQRAGVGRALMAVMAEHLLACRINSASLWVIKENAPARKFYEALGGRAVAEKDDRRTGYTLREVAYGWEDVRALLV